MHFLSLTVSSSALDTSSIEFNEKPTAFTQPQWPRNFFNNSARNGFHKQTVRSQDPETCNFYSKILFSWSKIKEISLEIGIKKWEQLEVIKRYLKPCSTIFLIRENMFNLLDSVTLAALRFELSCHQKKMTLKIFCKIRNAMFNNQTSRCLFCKIRNCQFTKFLAE